jgi:NAD(P)-dependent dehydrogenase (short-subunit alcohol dehydrogenase family)
MKLEGRVAVITGAGQGLGAAIAEHFVREGASVLLCGRRANALAALRDRLTALAVSGQKVLACPADVARPEQVDALIDFALDALPHIDILVNNAGIYGPFGPIEEVDWALWTEAIGTNLLGTVYASRAVMPHLRQRRYGKIICLSGGGATGPLPGISAYAASKAAVVRFVETLAEEARGAGIDVNAVAPGTLATAMTDQLIAAGPDRVGAAFHARIVKAKEAGGTPLDVPARLCVFLGGAESDGITGKLISAPWDPWQELSRHRADLEHSDVYTLRRILPKDRGLSWGDK